MTSDCLSPFDNKFLIDPGSGAISLYGFRFRTTRCFLMIKQFPSLLTLYGSSVNDRLCATHLYRRNSWQATDPSIRSLVDGLQYMKHFDGIMNHGNLLHCVVTDFCMLTNSHFAHSFLITGYEMLLRTKDSVDVLLGPTGIDELYCIYGTGLPTTYQMIYLPPTFYRSAFPDQYPTLITGDGDGTVHTRSLQLCRFWPGAKSYEFPGAEHLRIVGDSRMIDLLRQISGSSVS